MPWVDACLTHGSCQKGGRSTLVNTELVEYLTLVRLEFNTVAGKVSGARVLPFVTSRNPNPGVDGSRSIMSCTVARLNYPDGLIGGCEYSYHFNVGMSSRACLCMSKFIPAANRTAFTCFVRASDLPYRRVFAQWDAEECLN